jgi:L-seryl-tRNA(Ser) seleniumtransferase
LRGLPAVQKVLQAPEIVALQDRHPVSVITATVRDTLEAIRREIKQSGDSAVPPLGEIIQRVLVTVKAQTQPTLRSAINATGIILHTGLGRARLSDAAVEAVLEVAQNHSLVEIDPVTGQRGSRQDHVRNLLCELTGAESALVLNNCAGAVFLAVHALAGGGEVLLSRGEMVEIGGAFRMPDIIRSSGATLVEVGTTNRTRLSDYAKALRAETRLILRCHPSNFAIVGFTEEVQSAELAELAHARGIPFMDDQGSGALTPLHPFGISVTSGSMTESLRAGCDVMTASGDKMLGGAQAGIVLGRAQYIERIAQHPLARALRVDKLTLAALEATLRLYRDPQTALTAVPTLRYLSRTPVELKGMANRLRTSILRRVTSNTLEVAVQSEQSQVGGGSLPGEILPTFCVALRSQEVSAEELSRRLRLHTPAIFGRIKHDTLLLDSRTLESEEILLVAQAVASVLIRD